VGSVLCMGLGQTQVMDLEKAIYVVGFYFVTPRKIHNDPKWLLEVSCRNKKDTFVRQVHDDDGPKSRNLAIRNVIPREHVHSPRNVHAYVHMFLSV